jgi:hypothetical protein
VTKPAKPPAKPSTSPTSRETSPAVAAAAAKLMHSDDPNVRKVAASALSQVEHTLHPGGRVGDEVLTRNVPASTFDVDDFCAQLPTLCASGTVGFNLSTRDEVEQAVTVARELGYEAKVDGLRVEVRRVP